MRYVSFLALILTLSCIELSAFEESACSESFGVTLEKHRTSRSSKGNHLLEQWNNLQEFAYEQRQNAKFDPQELSKSILQDISYLQFLGSVEEKLKSLGVEYTRVHFSSPATALDGGEYFEIRVSDKPVYLNRLATQLHKKSQTKIIFFPLYNFLLTANGAFSSHSNILYLGVEDLAENLDHGGSLHHELIHYGRNISKHSPYSLLLTRFDDRATGPLTYQAGFRLDEIQAQIVPILREYYQLRNMKNIGKKISTEEQRAYSSQVHSAANLIWAFSERAREMLSKIAVLSPGDTSSLRRFKLVSDGTSAFASQSGFVVNSSGKEQIMYDDINKIVTVKIGEGYAFSLVATAEEQQLGSTLLDLLDEDKINHSEISAAQSALHHLFQSISKRSRHLGQAMNEYEKLAERVLDQTYDKNFDRNVQLLGAWTRSLAAADGTKPVLFPQDPNPTLWSRIWSVLNSPLDQLFK